MDSLIESFFEYYEFLTEQKRHIVNEQKHDEGEPTSDGVSDSNLSRIQSDLVAQIIEFCATVRDKSSYLSNRMLEDIKFNICAFTDEIIIAYLGDKSDLWQKHLVEVKVFGSNLGGEKFFEVIDALLGMHERSYRNIAFLYALMLRLGFRGRYRGRESQSEVKKYLSSLLELAFGRSELAAQKYLFTENYQSIKHGSPSLLFPSYRGFFINISIFLLVYFVVYGFVWFLAIGDVLAIINQIKEIYPFA